MLYFLSSMSVVGLFASAVNILCALSPATVLHSLQTFGAI